MIRSMVGVDVGREQMVDAASKVSTSRVDQQPPLKLGPAVHNRRRGRKALKPARLGGVRLQGVASASRGLRSALAALAARLRRPSPSQAGRGGISCGPPLIHHSTSSSRASGGRRESARLHVDPGRVMGSTRFRRTLQGRSRSEQDQARATLAIARQIKKCISRFDLTVITE
jgi:hypothetical protein